jgi:hypothetical protein
MIRLPAFGIAALAFACLSLAACGSSTPGPANWSPAASNTWTKDGQSYVVASATFAGTRTDLSNQESVDVVLSHKGVRYGGTVPYPGCEGAAGLMTFTQKRPAPGTVILVGFAVVNSTSITVTYQRPADRPSDPGAMAAMRQTVCRV